MLARIKVVGIGHCSYSHIMAAIFSFISQNKFWWIPRSMLRSWLLKMTYSSQSPVVEWALPLLWSSQTHSMWFLGSMIQIQPLGARFLYLIKETIVGFEWNIQWSILHIWRSLIEAVDILARMMAVGMNFIDFVWSCFHLWNHLGSIIVLLAFDILDFWWVNLFFPKKIILKIWK